MKTIILQFLGIYILASLTIPVYPSDWKYCGDVIQPGLTPSVGAGTRTAVWIAGGSGTTPKVFRSTDGGYLWTEVSSAIMPHEITCIASLNENIAFAGEGIVNGNAHMFKTTDGGTNWSVVLQNGGNSGYFTGMVFTKARSNIFGLAISEKIYRTSNSGLNWVEVNAAVQGVSNAQNSLFIIDNYFYGFGLNNGAPRIRLTTDNAVSWATQVLTVPGNYTSAIAYHSNKLFAVAATSTSMPFIARTTDGGVTWTNVDIGPGLTGTCFVNWIPDGPVIYIMGENGAIKRSTDSGLNWVTMSTDSVSNLKHFDFVQYTNIVYGWAVSSYGKVIKLVDTLAILTGVNPNSNIPYEYSLMQNYPNPFNPSTEIEFALPKESFVTLSVYDAIGREIDVLINGNTKPGTHKVTFDGSNHNSGVYFYKLRAGDFTETKKMILLK